MSRGLIENVDYIPFKQAQRGFSLVELVIIIILLGVLSIVAVPRFMGSSGFSEFAYQQQLLGALRKLQIQAMQDSRAGFCFQMNFDQSANPAFGVPTDNFALSNQANTCSTSINFTANESMRTDNNELAEANVTLVARDGSQSIAYLGFDSMGKPMTSQTNCANGCTITFTGESSAQVCIESQGFVHDC